MNSKQTKVVSAFVPLLLSAGISNALAQHVPGGTLDPTTIPKYVTPMIIPPVLYDDAGGTAPINAPISMRPIVQDILPTTGCTAASTAQQAAGGPAIACVGDGFPATPLWGYGNPNSPATFHNPSFTVEVTQGSLTTIDWINELIANPEGCKNSADPTIDPACNYIPHIIQDANGEPIIDQTLHWAAPNQDCRDGIVRTDCRGNSALPYTGPIPMVTHVHGAHVTPESDGYPESWWLPAANNLTGFATEGTFYDDITGGLNAGTGSAVYAYPHDQPTTTLWYHDHSLGITRLNVYAGGAGFWLIRTAADGESGVLSGTLPSPAPVAAQDPNGDQAYRDTIREIPIAIQPKSFNADGTQYYPADRAFFEGLGTGEIFADNTGVNIPFLPDPASDIAPVWDPEAFFNTMVVNGNTWPFLDVAPERYRFRLLNAADSRFLNMAMHVVNADGTLGEEIPFYQFGAEQSQLPNVVRIETGFATPLPGDGRDTCPTSYLDLIARLPASLLDRVVARLEATCVLPVPGTFLEQALLVGPAERADVIVDFTGLADGTRVRMINTAPDAPFGGFPDVPADPGTSGQVMEFVVSAAIANPNGDPSTPAPLLGLDVNPGGVAKHGPSTVTRDLALLEEESANLCVTIDAVTGVIDLDPNSVPPTCDPVLGSVPFGPKEAVLGINGAAGGTTQLWDDPVTTNPLLGAVETWEFWNHSADAHPIHVHLVAFEVVNREVMGGAVRPAEPWEAGWKDMVIAYPGEVTRVKAAFDLEGVYVWHCHILSHEDNEMMVPFCVGNPANCPL